MARYGRRGIGDLIPTSGEGRALVEVKGRVGGKGGRMAYRRNSFARMRAGGGKKHPQYMIPYAPGDYGGGGGTGRELEPHRQYFVDSATLSGTANGATRGWLFALTPEYFAREGNQPNGIPGMSFGLTDSSGNSDRIRIAGMLGACKFVALSPGDTTGPDSPEVMFDAVFAWWKVQASKSSLAGGFRTNYPWESFSELDAVDSNVDTFVPAEQGTTSDTIVDVDGRFRAKCIRMVHRVGKIVPVYRFDMNGDIVGTTYHTTPIDVPLLRRIVCDVGKGEALALSYWMRNYATVNTRPAGPSGVFTFPTMRIKTYELD